VDAIPLLFLMTGSFHFHNGAMILGESKRFCENYAHMSEPKIPSAPHCVAEKNAAHCFLVKKRSHEEERIDKSHSYAKREGKGNEARPRMSTVLKALYLMIEWPDAPRTGWQLRSL